MKKIYLFSVLSSLLIAGGCSSLRVPYGEKNSSEESSVLSDSQNETKKESKKSNKKNQKKNTLPTDREHIHTSHQEKTYSAKDLEEGTVTGDWTIEAVNGSPAVGETTPYLKMSPSDKRVYGNNGCNTINASYVYNPADKQISFKDILSTMRLCNVDGITDIEINQALDATRSYTWDHNGDEYYLHFFDANGNEVMTLMHQNFDFLNGTWHISAIENEATDDPEMNIVIDIDEGKIHGNTGCNIFNGAVDIDMETVNTINFHNIITTRMACPNPENQTRLIVALEDAAHAKPIDENTVELLNLLRQPVLTLTRINK